MGEEENRDVPILGLDNLDSVGLDHLFQAPAEIRAGAKAADEDNQLVADGSVSSALIVCV